MLLPLLTACTAASAPSPTPPPLRATAVSEDATVNFAAVDEAAVIAFGSASGIGTADIVRSGDAWPRPLRLRFHLQGLEMVRVVYDGVEISGALSSSTGEPLPQQTVRTAAGEQLIAADSPFWLAISRAPGAETIEVALPEDFYGRGAEQFTVSWIDFYR